MKKISLYAASLLALGLGFTSCDQLHNDLRLEVPTNYVLETPEGADQLIVFGAEGSNVGNEWNVVTFNPYNVSTQVDFQVQVAKNVSDFETWDNLLSQSVDAGDNETNFTDADGLPYATFVSGIYTSPSFTVPGADFCDAVNAVYGFETIEEAAAEPVQVAYRVYAWVPGVEYSFIFSNIVTLPQVQSYLPIRDPRRIYVVGACQGWNIAESDMFVQETEAGSNIYAGSINVNAGDFMFRFYKELGDWDTNSLGAQVEDNPVEIEVTDNTYFGEVVDGKGSWSYPDWAGGSVEIELNLNDYTVKFTLKEGETAAPVPTGKVLYLVGQPQGWDINGDSVWIQETEEGSNVYSGTITVAAGQFQFRFYSALGNWDEYSVGSQNEDANVDIEFTDGEYSGPVVVYDPSADILGKGNWQNTSWPGGTVDVTIDLTALTIKMVAHEGDVPDNGGGTETPEPADDSIYLRGGMNDWGTSEEYKFIATDNENVLMTGVVTISNGTEFKVADATWGSVNYGAAEEGDAQNISANTNYSLTYDGKNIIMNGDFTGTATLTIDGDNYTLLLTPGN